MPYNGSNPKSDRTKRVPSDQEPSCRTRKQAAQSACRPTKLRARANIEPGERLVAITFIESLFADQHKPLQIYELNEVSSLDGGPMQWESRVRLDVVSQNLLCMSSI